MVRQDRSFDLRRGTQRKHTSIIYLVISLSLEDAMIRNYFRSFCRVKLSDHTRTYLRRTLLVDRINAFEDLIASQARRYGLIVSVLFIAFFSFSKTAFEEGV